MVASATFVLSLKKTEAVFFFLVRVGPFRVWLSRLLHLARDVLEKLVVAVFMRADFECWEKQ